MRGNKKVLAKRTGQQIQLQEKITFNSRIKLNK